MDLTDAQNGLDGRPSMLQISLAWILLIWYFFVWLVCIVGHLRMRLKYRNPPTPPSMFGHDSDLPFVTILRPIKGLDPQLRLCLSATCKLRYPKDKHELLLCVASPHDPAIPVIQEIIDQHPDVDVRLLVGEEDVGPNPKIRNLSRGYREAKGDIVWVLDSNIWVAPGILERSVRLLEGTDGKYEHGFKLVHHLPLCVDITNEPSSNPKPTSVNTTPLLSPSVKSAPVAGRFWSRWLSYGGGRLEEAFLSSSHCKFYTAINTIGIAPCIVGKSNLFRRSHLAEVTRDPEGKSENEGIVAFAENICEDHLLAERLWLTKLDEEKTGKRPWGKHGMGDDLVFQPVSEMTVKEYLARRTRWLRVRKYTVIAATLLEPGTESLLCSLLGGYAATTLPFFEDYIPPTWGGLVAFWLASVFAWAAVDKSLFDFLHAYRNTEVDENTPAFIRTHSQKRGVIEWAMQWLGREGFTWGVWAWSMWPGEVNWRGGRYRVRWKDMKVQEIGRHTGKLD
ncbi:Ceramide glucosyltransferase [Rhizina undulata]